jgi:hypothetical protein
MVQTRNVPFGDIGPRNGLASQRGLCAFGNLV